MNGNKVKFRYGTPVSSDYPELIPGSFVFDYESLALYIDTDVRRLQVKDPLKLSLSGGILHGSLEVVAEDGATMCSLDSVSGIVSGVFLETTGDIALDTAPNLYAVLDDTGRIRSRTLAEMQKDLGIIDPVTLGALAYKDSASGQYTPVGSVSTPTVTVNYDSESVIGSITAGDLPKYEVSGEKLTLDPGTQTTATAVNVMKNISSVTVSQPVFTGTESTITVS